MKWIELNRVRSSESVVNAAMPSLQRQVQEIEASASDAETSFMRHGLYDGDLALVVVWRTDAGPRKTREGLLVAQRLERLGPVDHAV